jgi:hypothetical protein
MVDVEYEIAHRAVVMSDGHPVATLSEIFDDPLEMEERIDWGIMDGKMWANTDSDGDRQRRRQAEFLVHRQVPLDDLQALICRTQATHDQVAGLLAAAGLTDLPVLVRPDFYYENKP